MKKRLMCLLCALLMVLPLAFTGCSDDDEAEIEESERKPYTITLYGITGETTTEEAIQAVQDKINEYTEGQFTTHVILRLYTEDEYYRVLEEKMTEIETRIAEEEAEAERLKAEAKELRKKGITTTAAPTEETTKEVVETYRNENGLIKTVYPKEDGTQVDIFMVQSYSKLTEYYERGALSSLNASLTSGSKVLKKYINPTLFTAATVDNSIVGIPNNHLIGEYTYLLLNKELVDAYYYTASDFKSVASLEEYLEAVVRYNPEYIPLLNPPSSTVEYFTEEPSVIGGVINASTNVYSRVVPKCLFNVKSYKTQHLLVKEYEELGYVQYTDDKYSIPEDAKVAAAYVKGDYTLREKYADDYYVVVYANPLARTTNAPGTVFCVSTYTKDVDRCMEVVTALTTSPTLRNTFQYGVENVHYTIDEHTGMYDIISNDYSMDPLDTGNMFILKQNSSMSEEMLKMSDNDWAYAKLQNQDVQESPYMLFPLKYITEDNYLEQSEALPETKADENSEGESSASQIKYPYMYTQEIMDGLMKLSGEMLEKLENFTPYVDEEGNEVDYAAYLALLTEEFINSEYYLAFSDTDNPDSPLSQYNAWYTANAPTLEM